MARLRVVELPGSNGSYLLVLDKVEHISPINGMEFPKENLPKACAGFLVFAEEAVEVE